MVSLGVIVRTRSPECIFSSKFAMFFFFLDGVYMDPWRTLHMEVRRELSWEGRELEPVCTVFVMTPPMNTPVREGETIEGSRTMRNRPYPVLKCSS